MNTAKHTVSNIKKRSLSALLALVMIFSLVPAANADFQGGMKGNAYNTITVYKWHRVHKQSDLPPEGQKVPVLLMWKGKYEDSSDKNEYMFYLYQDLSGTDSYHAHGEDALMGRTFDANKYEVQPFNTNSDYDVFYTLDKLSNIEVKMNSGRDKKNQDAKYGKIWFNNYIIKGDGDFDWGGYGAEDASRTNWSFYTKELDGKYAAPCTDETPLQIYYERGGWYDTGIRHSGQWVYAFEDSTYSFGSFAMYWGEKVTISAITEDYTVHSGMVMNVDNGVLLTDNHTITVMPGGVLSIEGQFYNNGTIQNYGTVILQPDACITSFLPKSGDAGTIVNSGGVVNVAEDAKQTLPLREAERAALQAEINSQKESLTAQNNTIAQKEVEKERLLLEVDEVTKLPLKERLENLKAAIDNAYALYDQTLTSVPVTLENAKQAILDGRTMDQLSQTEKNQIAKLESDAAKALEENEATYEKDKKAYQEQYDKLNKPVEAIDEQITAAKVSMSATQTLIEENTERLDRLSEQITRLKDLAKGANSNVRGEGNLVVMENARIIFNANSNCKLIVKDGGSCVCSGYMVLPHELTLNNSKLQIRKGGAMAIGYYFKYGLLNAQNLTPSNPTNVNFKFGPMDTWGNRASTAIWASGDYVIEVDGVLKYANGNGVYNTDTGQRDSIYLGKGAWNTGGMPSRKIDENGVEINTDAKGNTTRTYPDGATEYYNAATGVTTLLRANGNIVVTQSSGVSRETWATPKANGEENYITRNADGSYNEVSVETDEYKMWLDDNGTLVTEYKKPQKNDLILKREYKNGDREDEFADGKRIRYDSTGVEIASYDADPSGKFGIYSYTDRIETVLANGKTKSIEYIAGLYAGAKIEYDPLDEGVRDWWERQCAWTVTSARGGVTRCYVEEIDGVKCSVICFAGGLTCTRPSEEVDATYFKYESSLGAAPSGYLYDAKPYVITMWDTGVALDNGTTRYQRTDGTYLIYANVKDPATGEVKSVVVGNLTPAGTGIVYETSFYEKSATQHEEGELLWTVIAANGDVTTARALGKGDDRLALFFTGENKGKTSTMKIADANPEDYLESASAAIYDETPVVLLMPESRKTLDNGDTRYTRTDDTTIDYRTLYNRDTGRNEPCVIAYHYPDGASITYADSYYNVNDAYRMDGTILWTVNASNKGTVRALSYGKELVLLFSNGKTKTVDKSEDPEKYRLKAESDTYDKRTASIPLLDTETKTEIPSTTTYRMTDGSTGTFVKQQSTSYNGAVWLMRSEYPSGAVIKYETLYYEFSRTIAPRIPTGRILWTVTAENGDTTTARVFKEGEDKITLFFTGTNEGKTCTLSAEQADPRDYLVSGSAVSSYDEPRTVLPKPESTYDKTADGGFFGEFTDGSVLLTYQNGDYGTPYLRTNNTLFAVCDKDGNQIFTVELLSDGTAKRIPTGADYYEIYKDGKMISRVSTEAKTPTGNGTVTYTSKFNQTTSNGIKKGDLLWTIKTKDGGTIECKANGDGIYGKNNGMLVFDGKYTYSGSFNPYSDLSDLINNYKKTKVYQSAVAAYNRGK